MATKHIISPGIGFAPGSIKYIITRGLTSGTVTAIIGHKKKALLVPFRKKWIVAK